MKKVILALILLASLISLSLASMAIIDKNVNEILPILDTAAEANLQGDYSAALSAAKTAGDKWRAYQSVSGILLRHDESDAIGKELSQLEAYAITEDRDEFSALCAGIKEQLGHIRHMELPVPENIL